MKIAQKYSHLNGEEYLLVHHKKLYKEIIDTIRSIDASNFMTKESKEKTMRGKMLYSPIELNRTFNKKFKELGWNESRYQYYITTDQKILPELIMLPYDKQKDFLISKGIKYPISSYKQTDFVKDQIAVEVQFGKYAFVAFDLFVKHLLTKKMQAQMSSGVAYYEGEVYNVLRHGRNNPPVPLLILGIEQD